MAEEVVTVSIAQARKVQICGSDPAAQVFVRVRLGGREQYQTAPALASSPAWPTSRFEYRVPEGTREALDVKVVQKPCPMDPEELVLADERLPLNGVTAGFTKWVCLTPRKGRAELSVSVSILPAGKLEDKYDLREVIGAGATATVYRGVERATGMKVAVKTIDRQRLDAEQLRVLDREIAIMRQLRHPNIVQLYDVYTTATSVSFVLELVEGGELFDRIATRGRFAEKDAALLFHQMLLAVLYLHDRSIAHRDLKPENILLCYTAHGTEVKISDFGLSKDTSIEEMSSVCGSPDYVAPEVLDGNVYGPECDVWSLGVLLYVLLSAYLPFHDSSQSYEELYERISSARFDYDRRVWSLVSAQAKDLIAKMLVVDPKKRLTVRECLEHPWLTSNVSPATSPAASPSVAPVAGCSGGCPPALLGSFCLKTPISTDRS
eukprot:m51a1_g13952 putative myosin light chain (435) ;mRNA; r:926374-928245